MAEPSGFTRDDLRAAVASGILAEAQAARLLILSEARAGRRQTISGDDEPFELFRGFAEIFVSVGLVLLISGVIALSSLMGHPLPVLLVSVAVCWALALYFTKARRMALPSIVLATGYALSLSATVAYFLIRRFDFTTTLATNEVAMAVLVIAGLLVWYRVFKVPFTMFLVGLTGLALVFVLTRSVAPGGSILSLTDLFDLRQGSGLAIGTLIFGLIAFVAAMAFDMRDPYRLGRWAASGFWLHLLAAPALVNTVALTFYNGRNYALLAVAIAVITLLALIIDRRSFLTAAIGYMAFLIALVVRQNGGMLNGAWVILILGAFITAIGAFWTQLRAGVMRVLPDFPGKRRLPPYAE